MKTAYVDSSCIVAILFAEKGSARIAQRLRTYEHVIASNLLEAEVRSAMRREVVHADPGALLDRIQWVFPDRTLTKEFDAILREGNLHGADLWHLAVALFVAPNGEIDFLTLDASQRAIARRIGFSAP